MIIVVDNKNARDRVTRDSIKRLLLCKLRLINKYNLISIMVKLLYSKDKKRNHEKFFLSVPKDIIASLKLQKGDRFCCEGDRVRGDIVFRKI